MSSRSRRSGSREIFERLLEAYGPQGWWPGKSPFEVCVGAVLTQNTSWSNVERAVAALEEEGILHDPEALLACPPVRLAELIRPAGFMSRKGPTLRALAAFLVETCNGDPARLGDLDPREARAALLEIGGVGPETADSILLYAADVPVFVVDAYSRRIAERHELPAAAGGDDGVQAAFADGLPEDAPLFNEYHALLVRVGKEHCHKSRPQCEGCPLEPLLPEAEVGERKESR